MSYDIDLIDPITKKTIIINDPHFIRGGTYQIGGSNELTLNITYNYAKILHRVLQPDLVPSLTQKTTDKYDTGIRSLYGMTALEATPILEGAINKLADDMSSDYWEATEGNVKRALNNLLTLCKMRPDAIITGD